MAKSTTPYILYNGNCEEAFNFYKSAFGTEFKGLMRFSDVPNSQDKSDKIINVQLSIGKDAFIMGGDLPPGMGTPTVGNNVMIVIDTESVEETDKLYKALSEGGTITMPIMENFWNAYGGGFIDRFGINWMVNFQRKPAY